MYFQYCTIAHSLHQQASELLHLDISRLLLAHAGLSLVASLSYSPIWNLPLALYGLVVVSKDGGDEGEAVRQVRHLAG